MMMDVEGKIVIGSLKGNVYGVGKDLVAAVLESAGFKVVDLGVDVSPEAFVDSAVEEKADVIAISISTDESIPFLKGVMEILCKRNLRNAIKVVVGGKAVSEKTRKEYGVDAYARDARDCVKKIQALLARA